MQHSAAPRALARRNPRDAAPRPAAGSLREAATDLVAEIAQLHAENQLLREAIDGLPHGLAMFDVEGRLLRANARLQAIWGLPHEVLDAGTPAERLRAHLRGAETAASRAQLPLPAGGGAQLQEWKLDDGRTVEVRVLCDAAGRRVEIHDDVTAQREAARQAGALARLDPATGLPNRAVLDEELDRALLRNTRGETMALLLLQIDSAAPADEAMLRSAGQRLRQSARETDLVIAMEGGRFAVLQCGAPQPASSTAMARRAIDSIARPFENGATATLAVGVVIAPADGYDAPTLMLHADLAVQRALVTGGGGGALRYHDRELDQRQQTRRGLEQDLRLALERSEFELVYHPLVDMGTRIATGMEALLRWRHPRRGLLSPADFLPLAEEVGLMVPIGRWVLEQACSDAQTWPATMRVSVNVSPHQFRNGALSQDVQAALKHSGLSAQRLELEITEAAMQHDAVQALVTLHEVRALGVRVAMDDFGIGTSSLAQLRRFPFDRIKLDRTLLKEAATRPDTLETMRALVDVARSLGMDITVEGVETMEQLAALQRMDADEVQGFVFSRPKPASEIADAVQNLMTSMV